MQAFYIALGSLCFSWVLIRGMAEYSAMEAKKEERMILELEVEKGRIRLEQIRAGLGAQVDELEVLDGE
jgi:hypothetical protein